VSPDFQRLATWKAPICRRSVNYVITRRPKRMPGQEDLNVTFFHGSGKREPAQPGFFVHKRENRWFIQGHHNSDIAPHRGHLVFEVCPQRTSQTCGHCCPENRNGERFRCLACGNTAHADLDVA